ncbi:MAG: hypothetical protein R3253_07610, partial [Longimicrobiales bacterium]|nr:hypothetical protein [Longimicrobiales bacterium]
MGDTGALGLRGRSRLAGAVSSRVNLTLALLQISESAARGRPRAGVGRGVRRGVAGLHSTNPTRVSGRIVG